MFILQSNTPKIEEFPKLKNPRGSLWLHKTLEWTGSLFEKNPTHHGEGQNSKLKNFLKKFPRRTSHLQQKTPSKAHEETFQYAKQTASAFTIQQIYDARSQHLVPTHLPG